MKRRIIRRLVALTLILTGVVLLLTQLRLGSSRIVNAQTNGSKLTLSLSMPKSEYVQLESVPLTFTPENQTSRSVMYRGNLGIGRDIDFIVQAPSGAEHYIEGKKLDAGTVLAAPNVLPSGQRMSAGGLIDGLDLSEFIFPEVGAYTIRAKFTYDRIDGGITVSESVTSPPVSISIVAPKGRDSEAYGYIKSVLRKGRNNRATDADALNLQRNFVENYGDSVYAYDQIVLLAAKYRAMGDDVKALKEFCKLANDTSYRSRYIEKALTEIDLKLHPPDTSPLPESGEAPKRPNPCTRIPG